MAEPTFPNAIPTQKTALEVIEHIGKALPVLAAMVVILSLIFETSLLLPIGVGFLSYYSWQDFLRNAVVWIPMLVPIVLYPAFLSIMLTMGLELRASTRALEKQIVELGGTVPRKNYLWGVIWADLKRPRFWVFVLCLIAAVCENVWHDGGPLVLALSIFGLFVWVADGSPSYRALSDRVVSTAAQVRALLTAFFFACVLAAAWGSYAGRWAVTLPEDTTVQLKGDQPDAPKKMQCNVLRELNSVLLAICGGRLHAISNTSIEFVKYNVPKAHQ